MAFLLLGPGITVSTMGPLGSCSKKGVSNVGSSYCIAAAAVAFRVSVAEARVRIGIRQVVLSLVTARSRIELRSREAIVSDSCWCSSYDLHGERCRQAAEQREDRILIPQLCGAYNSAGRLIADLRHASSRQGK